MNIIKSSSCSLTLKEQGEASDPSSSSLRGTQKVGAKQRRVGQPMEVPGSFLLTRCADMLLTARPDRHRRVETDSDRRCHCVDFDAEQNGRCGATVLRYGGAQVSAFLKLNGMSAAAS